MASSAYPCWIRPLLDRTSVNRERTPLEAAWPEDAKWFSTIYLKNGNAVTGEIIRRTKSDIVIDWHGAIITFGKSEISRIGMPAELPDGLYLKQREAASWPHAHDPVIRLESGGVIDGVIRAADERRLLVRETWGEGHVDYELSAAAVEAVVFRDSTEIESRGARESLLRRHPALHRYELVFADKIKKAGRGHASGRTFSPAGLPPVWANALRSCAEFWSYFRSVLGAAARAY